MIELFKHLMPLNQENFDWIFANYGMAIYVVLFLVIFIETGLVAMPFLPGDSLLFMAGLFAFKGNLNLSYLLALLFVAAVLGDNCNYWIGRKVGIKIFDFKFKGKILVKKEYLDKTHLFFEKHGTKAIIMARFVPFVRTFAPIVAGIVDMDKKKFTFCNVVGSMLWVSTMLIAGHFLQKLLLFRF